MTDAEREALARRQFAAEAAESKRPRRQVRRKTLMQELLHNVASDREFARAHWRQVEARTAKGGHWGVRFERAKA